MAVLGSRPKVALRKLRAKRYRFCSKMYEPRDNDKSPVKASRTRSFGSRANAKKFHAGVGISYKKKPSKTRRISLVEQSGRFLSTMEARCFRCQGGYERRKNRLFKPGKY